MCDLHSLLHLSDTGYEAMQTLKIHPPSPFQSVTVVITVLATMGLTFTKTQWICVTHTYQSIHKITRLFHQQAHRACRLPSPWKAKRSLVKKCLHTSKQESFLLDSIWTCKNCVNYWWFSVSFTHKLNATSPEKCWVWAFLMSTIST